MKTFPFCHFFIRQSRAWYDDYRLLRCPEPDLGSLQYHTWRSITWDTCHRGGILVFSQFSGRSWFSPSLRVSLSTSTGLKSYEQRSLSSLLSSFCLELFSSKLFVFALSPPFLAEIGTGRSVWNLPWKLKVMSVILTLLFWPCWCFWIWFE